MLEKLKKQSIHEKIIFAVILAAVAAAVFYFSAAHGILQILRGPANLDTLPSDSLEGQYVRAKVYVIYDYYAEVTSDGKATAREYIIPIGQDEYIGLSLPKNKFGEADAVISSTSAVLNGSADSLNGATVTVTGTIHAMDEESRYYYTSYLTGGGLDAQQQELFLPLILDSGKVGAASTSSVYFFLVICCALLLFGFVPLILAFFGHYQKQIREMCAAQPSPREAEAQLNTFYAATTAFHRVRLSPQFLMYDNASSSWVLPTSSVAWVYQTTTQHRTNGIPTGKSYAVTIRSCYAGVSGEYSIPLSHQKEVQEFLAYLHTNLPAVIFGYSNTLKSMFEQNPDAFVSTVQAIQEKAEPSEPPQAG